MDDPGQFWDFTSALDKRIFAHLRYPRRYSDFLKVQPIHNVLDVSDNVLKI